MSSEVHQGDIHIQTNGSNHHLANTSEEPEKDQSVATNGQSGSSLLQDFDITVKLMLVGDSSVGKTCLLVKFKDRTFLSGSFICTVGIDFRNKVIEVDDTKVKMQIWDTAGQERFRSITRAYYRDAEALLIVYDITNRQTFDNIRNWVTEAKEYAKNEIVMMLLGNKSDLTAERQISAEEGQRLADENNMPFMETSAKTGTNVDLAFTAMAETLKELKVAELQKSSKPDSRSSLKRLINKDSSASESSCSC